MSLSFAEKLKAQRLIAEQNKILAGNPSFTAKLAAQKLKLEAMTKLGMVSVKQPSSNETTETAGSGENTDLQSSNGQANDLTPSELEQVKKPSERFYNFDPNRKKSQRKRDNDAAMFLLSQIDAGEVDRKALTDEQRETLAKYSGTGGALTGANGKKGSAYEYYTPKPIAESMWALLKELGFNGGKVLDPSAGVGIFSGTAPTNAAVDAIELNGTSGRINGLVNSGPGNSVTVSPFEAVAAATPDETYDAIITNVPFGSNSARGGNQLLDKRYQNESLENYFILRSLEKLKPGGLAVFITPPRCVSGKRDNERSLRQKASFKAEFLGAYRLPNSVFGTADADTITDVIAFRKYSKDALEKIDELREQSPETLEQANVCWPEYISGDYFKGEGKRFILGEFVPKDPNNPWDRAQVVNSAPVGEIAQMIKKFPGSRINWELLNATETMPIIYQEGDTITQAGQTLQMKDGQWAAVKPSGSDNQAIAMLSKMTTPYDAFINKVTFDEAKGLVDYLNKMARALDIPDWLRASLSKLNGMPSYWLPGIVGLSCAQVMEENQGEPLRYLETYPELSHAMAGVYSLAKTVPVGLSGALKDGIKIMVTHYSKKKGYSAVWRGDVQGNVKQPEMNDEQSFEGMRYRTKSQWVPLADAKSVIGDDFDPFSSSEYCLSGDGQSITKAGDYYVGNYGEFLRNIDREIASSTDEAVKAKLLRQKSDAEQFIDRVDPNSLTFNLFSPYISIDQKVEFLRRFVDPRFAISMERERSITNSDGKKVKVTETVDKYIIFDGKGDSDKEKLLNRFAQYLKNGTVTLGGAKVSMSTKEALTELRSMVSTANEQFGPWVKSNKTVIDGITKTANDPNKLRFKPIDDESAMPIPGLNTDVEKGGKPPHGYQYAFIRKQGREFGGINGFGVGLGKTLTSLASVQHVQNIGVKKKTAFVVPNSVLSNWRKEAIGAYENTDDCLFIGLRTNQKGKDVVKSSAYDEDLTAIMENRHSKIFMSMEAFERIRMREPTIEQFAGYMRTVDASFAESELNAEEEASKSKLAKLMEGLRSKKGSAPFLEDLGIDSLVLDEAHAMKNSAMAVNTKQARYLSLSAPSNRGFDAQAKAWYIRGKSPLNDGVLLLSATPLTNSPMEVYAMLSLAVGHDRLNDAMLGIRGTDNFLSVVCDIQGEQDVSIDGIERDINVFQGLNNVGMLRKTLSGIADIKDADDVGSQVVLPESEDKSIQIDLPEAISDRLRMYKGAFRYAVDAMSERPENRGDEDAYQAVADYFGEPLELIGHPFNLINKMTMLIADPELDARGTFFTFSESQKDLAEKVVTAFNAKKVKEKRSRPGPLTKQNMIVGKKTTKNADTDETKVEYTIQVEAGIAKNRITIDTMDSATQTLFEDMAEKQGLDLDVTIPPKLAALLENVQTEAANPRGVDENDTRVPFAKQIIFCDVLALHNKIRRVLSKKAGISRSAIAIITGQTNNSPDEIMEVQMGFNASGEDNKYRIIIANEKAEVGINLQIGTQAIHHLTIGWTPDSLTQRNGRCVRQGNKTERVSVYYYDANGTFDVAKRSMVDKKSEWIDQVMDVSGGNKVKVTGGLSREQMEALIDVVGDADGMTRLQESIAAKDAEGRAKTNRDKQMVNVATIQKQMEFMKSNNTAENWAIKKVQALYVMKLQLDNLRNRLSNAKTETARARNEMAIADLRVKFDGLKNHIASSVAFTGYSGVDELLTAINGFYRGRGDTINDVIARRLRGDLAVSENSEMFSDWRSEYDMAQAMIDESKSSFVERSKEEGGYPAEAIDAVIEDSAVVMYGKPVIKGAFVRIDGKLAVIDNPDGYYGGVIYWNTESNIQGSLKPDDVAKNHDLIYPGSPDYAAALLEAAQIEDKIADAGRTNTPYSAIVGEVKNYRKNVGIAEYSISNYILPPPHFPYVMIKENTPVMQHIKQSQQDIVKSAYYGKFTVAGDVEVQKRPPSSNTLQVMKDYASAHGLKLVPDDIAESPSLFGVILENELSLDDFQTAISGAENEQDLNNKAHGFVAAGLEAWFDPGQRSFADDLPLPSSFKTAITEQLKAIRKSSEKPDDVVAISGRGTWTWKETLKEFAEKRKPENYVKSYAWDGTNKAWLISRAAWDDFADNHPNALGSLNVVTSNRKI